MTERVAGHQPRTHWPIRATEHRTAWQRGVVAALLRVLRIPVALGPLDVAAAVRNRARIVKWTNLRAHLRLRQRHAEAIDKR